MAHHKLRALGVDFERAGRLVCNPPYGRTYPSPIRVRLAANPMTGRAACPVIPITYIIQLDLKDSPLWPARMPSEIVRLSTNGSLSVILPKLEFGMQVLRKHLESDSSGDAFVAGLYSWTDRLLEEGEASG